MARKNHKYATDDDLGASRPEPLSSNGHWIFGSIYAVLTLIGFCFGLWAGVPKPKPVEAAEAKKDPLEKPAPKTPNTPPPATTPPGEASGAELNKPKPTEVSEAKKDLPEKPAPKPGGTPSVTTQPSTTTLGAFKLTDQSLTALKKEQVPDAVLTKLSAISNKELQRADFEREIGKLLTADEADKFLVLILNHATLGVSPVVGGPKPKEPEPKQPPVKAVAFKEVAPVFRSYCGNCHGLAGKPKGGVDLRTVAAIMKGGDDGALVKPGDPDKSPLYDSIKAGRMPPDGKPGPSEKELMLIRDWIAGGAKERRRTVRRRDLRIGRARVRS